MQKPCRRGPDGSDEVVEQDRFPGQGEILRAQGLADLIARRYEKSRRPEAVQGGGICVPMSELIRNGREPARMCTTVYLSSWSMQNWLVSPVSAPAGRPRRGPGGRVVLAQIVDAVKIERLAKEDPSRPAPSRGAPPPPAFDDLVGRGAGRLEHPGPGLRSESAAVPMQESREVRAPGRCPAPAWAVSRTAGYRRQSICPPSASAPRLECCA